MCHYGYNAYYLNLNVDPANIYSLNNAPGVTLAAINQPTMCTLIADDRGINGKLPDNHLSTYVLPPSQADADYWGRPEPRHTGGVVLGLMDGHVKWFRPESFYMGQNPADAWFQRELRPGTRPDETQRTVRLCNFSSFAGCQGSERRFTLTCRYGDENCV